MTAVEKLAEAEARVAATREALVKAAADADQTRTDLLSGTLVEALDAVKAARIEANQQQIDGAKVKLLEAIEKAIVASKLAELTGEAVDNIVFRFLDGAPSLIVNAKLRQGAPTGSKRGGGGNGRGQKYTDGKETVTARELVTRYAPDALKTNWPTKDKFVAAALKAAAKAGHNFTKVVEAESTASAK